MRKNGFYVLDLYLDIDNEKRLRLKLYDKRDDYDFNFADLMFTVCLLVLNATFNNISAISWRSVLLVEETGGPGENYRPVASHWQTLSHYVVHHTLIKIRTHNISGDMHCLHR